MGGPLWPMVNSLNKDFDPILIQILPLFLLNWQIFGFSFELCLYNTTHALLGNQYHSLDLVHNRLKSCGLLSRRDQTVSRPKTSTGKLNFDTINFRTRSLTHEMSMELSDRLFRPRLGFNPFFEYIANAFPLVFLKTHGNRESPAASDFFRGISYLPLGKHNKNMIFERFTSGECAAGEKNSKTVIFY